MRIDKLEAKTTEDCIVWTVTATLGRYILLDPQGITKVDFGGGFVGYAVSDGAIGYEPPPINKK